MSDIEVVFYPVAAVGLLIFIVALWSRDTFNISIPRIRVSISLYYFLFMVDIETIVPPVLVFLYEDAGYNIELYSWGAALA